MTVCYNRLWKMMIDRQINKTQLCHAAKISTNAMAKMGRNEEVRLEVLTKICGVLNCTLDDIVELIPDSQERGQSE